MSEEFNHVTVMLVEAVEGLDIKPDGIYVDCTLGGGGHSERILRQLTTGHLYCFDQDEEAIEHASKRLSKVSDNFTIIDSNFVHLKQRLRELGVEKVDGVLFDLGVSSPQFDEDYRGFSYNKDARLDMRMDTRASLDAYQIVNEYSYEQIVGILLKYGEEKFAKSIARRIEQERAKKPIETTFELVEIIKTGIPAKARRTGGHPAKKTFQALRVAVNDELRVFEVALNDALDILKVDGRVSVITFQSLEDRICKTTFKERTTVPNLPNIPVIPDYMMPSFELVNRKATVASEEELNENHRSHSAKLRVIKRIKD